MPFPVILSAPSGGGKTTISKELLARRADTGYSVSATTRPPRPAEVNGRDYHFLTPEDFATRRGRGDFAESAQVHGRWYGTLRSEVDRLLESGRNVIMDIDVQGAREFVGAYRDTVLIFLLPPSAEVLLARLRGRRTEDAADLVVRLDTARRELQAIDAYQYVVVNGDLDRAVGQVSAIIEAESLSRRRVGGLAARTAALIGELERETAALRERVK